MQGRPCSPVGALSAPDLLIGRPASLTAREFEQKIMVLPYGIE